MSVTMKPNITQRLGLFALARKELRELDGSVTDIIRPLQKQHSQDQWPWHAHGFHFHHHHCAETRKRETSTE
jgi:hypothetical protein